MLFLSSIFCLAQELRLPPKIIVPARIIGKDTLPYITLGTIEVIAKLTKEEIKNIQKYYKLRRDVLKVWPYAKLAAAKLNEINDNTLKLKTEKERKRYIKTAEKQLKEEFQEDLKKLTITQGRILIKLIDRETGNTTYALVKELRSSLHAIFWQGVARLFGSNLKAEYDSVNNDKAIEAIIRSISPEKE